MSVYIVVGAGFGDEGKGSITDFLVREHSAKMVVRFCGGAQAGHNVVTSDGRHHVFSQFGSGTLAGALTHLSRYMLVNPLSMVAEAKHLAEIGVPEALSMVTVDQEALVTTPFHVSLNRIREMSRRTKQYGHGSCGMGIGETATFALTHPEQALCMGDLQHPSQLREKLAFVQDLFAQEADTLHDVSSVDVTAEDRRILHDSDLVDELVHRYLKFLQSGVQIVDGTFLPMALQGDPVIFEGAQGVLLDEDWGFHPYTTHSNCTYQNADHLLAGYSGKVHKIAVLRAYHTRHGAGPLPTEAPELQEVFQERHNTTTPWQQGFRVGYFDLLLGRYARRALGPVDGVALTHLDRVHGIQQVCVGYRWPWKDEQSEIPWVTRAEYERVLQVHQQANVPYQHPLCTFVKPRYDALPDRAHLVSKVEEAFQAPVVIQSHGSRAEDKHPC